MDRNVEREVKLTADPDVALSFDGAVEQQSLQTVYYDTPDLRLARWGVSLRCRTGESGGSSRWTVKLPSADAGASVLARTEVVVDGLAGGDVPLELAHLVRGYVRHAGLAPVATLHANRRRVLVPGVGEVDDDHVTVLGDGGGVVRRFREIEVELAADASPDAADALIARLIEAGARRTDGASKLQQALGVAAGAPPDVVVPSLDRRATLIEVARASIAAGTHRLLVHDPGVRLGDDPEDVHQARVATRRMRSDLRTFAPAFADTDGLRDELRWLGGALGRVRDADVLLERLAAHVDALPAADAKSGATLLNRLRKERDGAREVLLADLDSDRYVMLVDALVDAANGGLLAPGEDAGTRAADVLPSIVHKQWRRLKREHAALSAHPEDAALHQLRIRAKRARYAAEAASKVLGKPAARFGKAAAGLQEVLGDLQDAVVAEEWLRTASKARGSTAGAAFVGGVLVARERAEQEAARRSWPAAWDDVVAARKRWLS